MNRRGSILLECVMALPLALALMLGCMQIAHLWTARQVTLYAATAAARSLVTAHESEYQDVAEQAAQQVLAWTVIGQAQGEPEKELPGWGKIPGSGSVERKTRVKISELDDWNFKVDVEFDFGLLVPIAGPMLGWAVNPADLNAAWKEQQSDPTGNAHRYIDSVPYPHVTIYETAIVAKPFKTLYETGLPPGGW